MKRRFIFLILGSLLLVGVVVRLAFSEKSCSGEGIACSSDDSLATGKGGDPGLPASGKLFTADEWRTNAFNAVATEPATALDLARQLIEADPEDRQARVSSILLALCDAKQFTFAQTLAREAPDAFRENWLQVAFVRWAQNQPQEAINAIAEIVDPKQHSIAFRAIVDGWNQTHPDELAAYVFALPHNDDRDYALSVAIDNWAMQDPVALANWLKSMPRGPEFDCSVTLMLARTDSVNRNYDVAVNWMESIGDAKLRWPALLVVLDDWQKSDPVAARNYVKLAPWLDTDQREKILAGWSSSPDPDKG